MICGSAKELCRQYRNAILNGLKCVRMWLDPPNCHPAYRLCTVPGGGAVEFALVKTLKLPPDQDFIHRNACQIVSQVLLLSV